MLIEIIRQSLYTRDIQPTSNPLQICGHLRSRYACTGCLLICRHLLNNDYKTPPTDRSLWEGFCNNISKRKLIYFLLANALIPPATKSIEEIITPDTSTIA